MKLFQMAVFTAVLFSNVRWPWTPNAYLASIIAGAAAFGATWLAIWTGAGLRWLRRVDVQPRGGRGQHRVDQRALPLPLPLPRR